MTTNPDLTAEMPSGVDTAPVRAPEIALLGAPGAPDREAAWGSFVARHTPMLLRIARAVTQDHDAAMDAYAFVLGQLREHDFRRLLAYQITDNCTFTTWLTVVARRLCLDHQRSKYGRSRTDEPNAVAAQRERRKLADLTGVIDGPELVSTSPDPAAALEEAEKLNALESALEELSPGDRLLLRYRFDDDLSAREIARLLRLPSVFHVYRRINALLASCKRALQQRGVRGSDA